MIYPLRQRCSRAPAAVHGRSSSAILYGAIVTALYKRERTARQPRRLVLLMNGIWANACSVQSALCGQDVDRLPERSQHPMPWRNCYRASDGKWLMLSIVHNDARWATFRKAVQSDLLDDARFADTPSRRENAVALTATLDKIFAQRPAAEWEKILDEHGVVFGSAHNVFDLINDEQARISGALVPVADGSILTVSSPFWIAAETCRRPAGYRRSTRPCWRMLATARPRSRFGKAAWSGDSWPSSPRTRARRSRNDTTGRCSHQHSPDERSSLTQGYGPRFRRDDHNHPHSIITISLTCRP